MSFKKVHKYFLNEYSTSKRMSNRYIFCWWDNK